MEDKVYGALTELMDIEPCFTFYSVKTLDRRVLGLKEEAFFQRCREEGLVPGVSERVVFSARSGGTSSVFELEKDCGEENLDWKTMLENGSTTLGLNYAFFPFDECVYTRDGSLVKAYEFLGDALKKTRDSHLVTLAHVGVSVGEGSLTPVPLFLSNLSSEVCTIVDSGFDPKVLAGRDGLLKWVEKYSWYEGLSRS